MQFPYQMVTWNGSLSCAEFRDWHTYVIGREVIIFNRVQFSRGGGGHTSVQSRQVSKGSGKATRPFRYLFKLFSDCDVYCPQKSIILYF
jgi:hypothetical protein